MPVRKPTNTSQFDLFAAPPPAPPRPTPMPAPPKPANDRPAPPVRRSPLPATVQQPPPTDEWWTTRMTCAFLKISRKTLWERRRDPGLNFPQPVQLGGTRNLYRASAVRGWAEDIAADADVQQR
jgi:predicted DNA-binding transcriptional regulator AlpA